MKRHHSYHVYLLRCSDGSYYAGVTNDVERRLWEHQHAFNPNCYTASRLPVELVWSEWFRNVDDAIAFKKQLKGWSRKKKEALIRGDWNAIQELLRKTSAPAIPQAVLVVSEKTRPFDFAQGDN